MAADGSLVETVRRRLAEVGDPAKAPGMQAYMKSAMPYRGVPSPAQKMLAREVFAAHPLPDRVTWRATVLELWREAGYREERYLAIALTGWPAYMRYQDPSELGTYEELVVTGAWWDYVDEVAIRRIGPILRGHREQLTPVMHAWSVDADHWKRRTAIICQIKAKGETDLALLAHCIEANAAERDFFLRKAIGWALRDYAWHDPEWVRRYVATRTELSPLTRREATRNLR
jgi:3-methyladenine DNA glycosylase AlkD